MNAGEAVHEFITKLASDPELVFDDNSVLILQLARGGILVVANTSLADVNDPRNWIAGLKIVGEPLIADVRLLVEA